MVLKFIISFSIRTFDKNRFSFFYLTSDSRRIRINRQAGEQVEQVDTAADAVRRFWALESPESHLKVTSQAARQASPH